MRRHAKTAMGGHRQGDGNGRGLARRTPLALIAALALLGCLGFTSTASAAPGPPVVGPVVVEELGYHSVKVSATVESDSEPGYDPTWGAFWCFEYAAASEPVGEEQWKGGQVCQLPSKPGKDTVTDEFTKLKPDTTYKARLNAFNGFEGYSQRYSPEPYTTFTTKPVNKPSGTLAISDVTLDTARISGTVDTNAPPGPLTALEKAAYRTDWQIICRPSCQFGTPSSTGVVQGDEGSQSFTYDTIRLETNTFYEVELLATNADGAQTAIIEETFTTPNIAPKVTPAPGGSSGKGAYSIGAVVTPYNTKITDCHFEYGPTTEYVYSAPCSPQPVGRDEIQVMTIGGQEGQFKLVFRGQTTDDIDFPAPPEVIEEELKALSAIGPEGIEKVTREDCFFCIIYKFYFSGPLSGTNLNPIKGINGTKPLDINDGVPCPTPTFCGIPDPGFAGSVVDGGNNAPIVVEADLTGLTPGATYHYKVFATNNVGTVSSEDIRFVAPLDPADKPCPNEAIRIENNSTRLPECRAYELVTTAFKASNAATLNQLSVDEGTISYSSLAGNINNSGSGGIFTNNYIAERHETGWETVANLNGPRGSLYANPDLPNLQFAFPARYAPDLIHSMWYLEGAGYLREPDGTFVRLTNISPNEFGDAYRGGSDDFSHTIWTGNSAYGDAWGPGIGPGLYEYIGVGHNEPPFRVDVHDNGEPISNCLTVAFNPGSVQDPLPGTRPISRDGRVVTFLSRGCPGGLITYDQVWVRVDDKKSYFASKSQCTRTASDPGGVCNDPPAPIDAGAYQPRNPQLEYIADDGSRNVFLATQQLVNGDTDETKDLYEYIVPTESNPNPSPNLIQVSAGPNPAKVLRLVGASDDGSTIYFIAQGVLASNHDAHDEPPFPGDFNLYVWREDAAPPYGQTSFVARLEDPPQNYDVSYFKPEVSADGRYMVFQAYHPMVETDTDNSKDIYRYDALTGEMTRVSVDTAGVGGNADFTDAEIGGFSPEHVISDDGQQIVFTTSEALSPDDGNGAPDAYIWQDGHTSLISTGAVGGGADRVLIDGSGDNIYITSPQQLTANDIDDVPDVYNVRRGGGFSFQELPPCAGEGCQPAGTPGPDNGAPATDHAGGEGNYRPAAISIRSMSSSQRAKLAAGGEAEVPLKVSGPGKISLKGSARIRKRSSQVIDASSRAVQAGVVNVAITLPRRALSQLRKKGALNVQLTAVLADSEAATARLKLTTAEARRKRSRKGNA